MDEITIEESVKKSTIQKLREGTLERNSGYKKGYISYRQFKQKAFEAREKGKSEIAIPKSKMRQKEIIKLKSKGFEVHDGDLLVCMSGLWKLLGLYKSKYIVSWVDKQPKNGFWDGMKLVLGIAKDVSTEVGKEFVLKK